MAKKETLQREQSRKAIIQKKIRFTKQEHQALLDEMKLHRRTNFTIFAKERLLSGYQKGEVKHKAKIDNNLIFQLNKCGTNINQIAKWMNSTKQGIMMVDDRRHLDELDGLLREILKNLLETSDD